MKYLFVAIVGILLGAAAAVAVLYFNPLSVGAAPPPGAADRVLRYSLPNDVLEVAIGEDARLFGHDTGDASLWEETIDRTAVLGLTLNDGSGQPASPMTRAGTPATVVLCGTGLRTTEPEATRAQ